MSLHGLAFPGMAISTITSLGIWSMPLALTEYALCYDNRWRTDVMLGIKHDMHWARQQDILMMYSEHGVLPESVRVQSLFLIGLGRRFFCALIVGSLGDCAQRMPPGLVLALIQRKRWAPTQGLSYARRIPEARRRALSLAGLVTSLPFGLADEAAQEALIAARASNDMAVQAFVLGILADHLSPEALDEYIRLVLLIEEDDARGRALSYLADSTLAPILIRALPKHLRVGKSYLFADMLVNLAQRLPEADMLQLLAKTEAIGLEPARQERYWV